MSAMINLSATKKTDTINVNVKPITHINVGNTTPTTPTETTTTSNVYADLENDIPQIPAKRDVAYEDWDAIIAENKVLKLEIQMLQSNPVVVNKFIIADDAVLKEFVQALTFADEVQIDADDLAQGCFSSKTYRKVHNIFVIKDGETKNLKYDYPKVVKTLLDLRISTKFVW